MRHRRTLTLLFVANGVSGFAQGISMLAVPWYFAQQGGASQFNLLYAALTALMLFWGLYAGTIVDRFDRRRVFLLTNVVEGVVLGAVAAIGWQTGQMPLGLAMVAFGVTALGYQIHYPNLYAFVQQLTDAEDYGRVNSLIEVIGQTTAVLSGGMAAVLLEGFDLRPWGIGWQVAPWTITEIFTMDCITYLISVGLIWLMASPPRPDAAERGPLLARLRGGFRFLREQPVLWLFGVLSYVAFAALLITQHGLRPLYIADHLRAGGAVLGLSQITHALGAVSAGLGTRWLFRRASLPVAVTTLAMVVAAGFLLAGLTQHTALFLLLCAVLGFANSGIRITRLSYLFERVPNALIGRVNSVFSLFNIGLRVSFLTLFGQAFFGVDGNVHWAYFILGVCNLLAAAGLVASLPRLRRVALT